MDWILIVIWVHAHAEFAGFARFHTQLECEYAMAKVEQDFPKADEIYCLEKPNDQ